MAKRQKKPPEGAPLWMVTYGDMVTLLLTFFVMLSSLANYDDPSEKFMAAIQSIRQALGMKGQVGSKVDPSVDFHSLLHKLESVIKPDQPRDRGDTNEEGLYGKNFRLRRIRDGAEITIGGPILFELFSAELTEKGKESLSKIAEVLKGHRNKIEIRGHAGEKRPADWTYDDAVELSHLRAINVGKEMISRGIDHRTVRYTAVGANEPVARKVYKSSKRGDNRRVEIIVRESLIDDYNGQGQTSDNPTASPASEPVTQTSQP